MLPVIPVEYLLGIDESRMQAVCTRRYNCILLAQVDKAGKPDAKTQLLRKTWKAAFQAEQKAGKELEKSEEKAEKARAAAKRQLAEAQAHHARIKEELKTALRVDRGSPWRVDMDHRIMRFFLSGNQPDNLDAAARNMLCMQQQLEEQAEQDRAKDAGAPPPSPREKYSSGKHRDKTGKRALGERGTVQRGERGWTRQPPPPLISAKLSHPHSPHTRVHVPRVRRDDREARRAQRGAAKGVR